MRAFKSFLWIFSTCWLGQDLTHNDTIVIFQIQSNLDIQLSFFSAVSWGCAEEPPTEDYEDCITEERWESIFKINVKMFISQLYKLYIGSCSLAMPIQYNLCNISGTATVPKLCAIATLTCATRLNHLTYLFFL